MEPVNLSREELELLERIRAWSTTSDTDIEHYFTREERVCLTPIANRLRQKGLVKKSVGDNWFLMRFNGWDLCAFLKNVGDAILSSINEESNV